MDQKTKQFVIKTIAIAASLATMFLLFAYVSALFDGRTTVPDQVASALSTLVVVACSSAVVWLHSRNSIKTRQIVLDSKEEIKRTMVDGGGEIIAEKVAEKVAPMIHEGERHHPAIPNDTGERRRGTDPHANVDDTERWR